MARSKAQMVGVEEAADRLGVSLATVWRRIRSGGLPSVLSRGRRLVPASALAETARRRTEEIPPMTPDHPIFRLAGAYRSGGAGPGSGDKHAILDR